MILGVEPPARCISLKEANPEAPVWPNALAPPLNALKASSDAVFELLGVALLADGVDGCANPGDGFDAAPITLVWPNTEPGVAGTGTFGAEDWPPNALTAWDEGFGFPNGDVDGVPPKTVVPVPLIKVASPVFHAGTASSLFDAVWPNAESPVEVNALNPPLELIAGAAEFVSADFAPPNVVSPPDANAPNPPPLPNVEEDVGLIGVAIGVVDIGVPTPALPNPDCPNPD